MSVNVQLESGLCRISGKSSINLNQILNALGFFPANSESLYNHVSNSIIHVTEKEKNKWNSAFSGKWEDLLNKPMISSDNNDKVVFADSNGNIIAQIDKDGFKTTEIYIRGINIRDLISEKKGFSGYYNDLIGAPAIYDNSSEELVFADKNGYIVGKLNYEGLTITNILLGASKKNISDWITNIEAASNSHIRDLSLHVSDEDRENLDSIETHIGNLDIHITDALKSSINSHLKNAEIHVSLSQKNSWNSTVTDFKSHSTNELIHVKDIEKQKWNAIKNFSGSYFDLTEAPPIVTDTDNNSFIIKDKMDYKIAEFDYTGLTTPALFIKNDSGKIENILNIINNAIGSVSIDIDYETYIAFDVTEIVG